MSARNHIRHIAVIGPSEAQIGDLFYCGRLRTQFDWYYIDLSHALVSKERDWIQPCKQCLKKAQKEKKKI